MKTNIIEKMKIFEQKLNEGDKIKQKKKESQKELNTHCVNNQMGLFLRFHDPTYSMSKQKDQGHKLASGGD